MIQAGQLGLVPLPMLRTFRYTTFDGHDTVSVVVGDGDSTAESKEGSTDGDSAQRFRAPLTRANTALPGCQRPRRLLSLSACQIAGVKRRREGWSTWDEYQIVVTTMVGSGSVAHRFREFVELHQYLERKHPRRCTMFFPRRLLWGSLDADVVQHRRMSLEAFLTAVMRDKKMRRDARVIQFLKMKDMWRRAAQECLTFAEAVRVGRREGWPAFDQVLAGASEARISARDTLVRAVQEAKASLRRQLFRAAAVSPPSPPRRRPVPTRTHRTRRGTLPPLGRSLGSSASGGSDPLDDANGDGRLASVLAYGQHQGDARQQPRKLLSHKDAIRHTLDLQRRRTLMSGWLPTRHGAPGAHGLRSRVSCSPSSASPRTWGSPNSDDSCAAASPSRAPMRAGARLSGADFAAGPPRGSGGRRGSVGYGGGSAGR